MIRTGIYGGSFNPIHTGHTQLGKALLQQGLVDELWFLVSPQNPLKKDMDMLPDTERLELAKLALTDEENMAVSNFEFSLPRPSYMLHTLKALEASYPDRHFMLVIGADNWECFSTWYCHEEILARYPIIVYPRPGYDLANVPSSITITQTPMLDISSTSIRESIANGTCNGSGLHPAVWQEIKQKGYYK